MSTDFKLTMTNHLAKTGSKIKSDVIQELIERKYFETQFQITSSDDQQNKLTNSSAVCHTNQHIDFVNRIKCYVTTNKEQREFRRN